MKYLQLACPTSKIFQSSDLSICLSHKQSMSSSHLQWYLACFPPLPWQLHHPQPGTTSFDHLWVDLIYAQSVRFHGDDNHPLAVPSCNSFPLQGFHLQILSHESLNLPKPTPNSHGVMFHVKTYRQKGHGMRKCISHLWLDRGNGHQIRSFLSGFV